MKRVVTIAAGVAVGLGVIVIVLLAIQFLISGNSTSINVHNDSNVPLQAVAVFVPDSVFSGHRSDMSPGGLIGFDAQTKMFLPLRIAFDAQGQHYEVSSRVLLPPVGAYRIAIYID